MESLDKLERDRVEESFVVSHASRISQRRVFTSPGKARDFDHIVESLDKPKRDKEEKSFVSFPC